MRPSTPEPAPSPPVATMYAVLAFTSWGLTAIYFKALAHVPALQIAAHRIVWASVFLTALLAARRELGAIATGPRLRTALRSGLITAPIIAGNWLLYIWAVNSGRLLEASLGYFINPLVNVTLGLLFLREPLNRRQAVAVLLAAAGVAYQVIGYGHLPVVSLLLATSFGVYGLIRKKAGVDPIGGLWVETVLLTPIAVGYLAWLAGVGDGAFVSAGARTTGLLLLAGALTALPLIWFQVAVSQLRLSTIGLLQYLAPTCQLLLAVLAYGEAFTWAHGVTFGFIWSSLALYTWDAWRTQRRAGVARAAAAARG